MSVPEGWFPITLPCCAAPSSVGSLAEHTCSLRLLYRMDQNVHTHLAVQQQEADKAL